MAATYAQFIVDTLHGKGDVIVWGGAPGAPQTAAQMPGWKKVFAANPGIKVLEGPVISNWDPAKYQEVMTALLTKYPKIDAMYSDYGSGILGALRAFETAGRPMVPVTGLDANGAQCYYLDHKAGNPDFQIGLHQFVDLDRPPRAASRPCAVRGDQRPRAERGERVAAGRQHVVGSFAQAQVRQGSASGRFCGVVQAVARAAHEGLQVTRCGAGTCLLRYPPERAEHGLTMLRRGARLLDSGTRT